MSFSWIKLQIHVSRILFFHTARTAHNSLKIATIFHLGTSSLMKSKPGRAITLYVGQSDVGRSTRISVGVTPPSVSVSGRYARRSGWRGEWPSFPRSNRLTGRRTYRACRHRRRFPGNHVGRFSPPRQKYQRHAARLFSMRREITPPEMCRRRCGIVERIVELLIL